MRDKAPPALDGPKHGKVDDAEHIGGSSYAGGSGGSNTAGLGGRGGPYRLAKKNQRVHQVSEAAKAEVSAEAQARARAMAEAALAERLAEINMTAAEHAGYGDVLRNVAPEVAQLRVVLDGLRARERERVWRRHQADGELDDAKLVDGAVGDRNVYKRRADAAADPLDPSQAGPRKVKRLLFVLDCSGSMYRFNGDDGRLDRLLETAAMLMEGLDGFAPHRFDYAMVGHSGDGPAVPLVDFGAPPPDAVARFRVLQRASAHAQFCMSGDYTVEAAARAVDAVARDVDDHGVGLREADEKLVFVVSDANLRRYGIRPRDLGDQLVAGEHRGVKAVAIFIATIADEAERIRDEIPAGRAFVCLDTADLPALFRSIFTSLSVGEQ